MRYKLLSLLLLLSITLFAKPVKVIRVIDGDTFVIETGERIRMLGINAPEMKTEEGPPAKQHLFTLIEGKLVELEPDHISNDKDVYGRLLRYVYLNGVDIDKQMVSDGYAIAFLKYAFDKQDEYRLEETKAKSAALGIWASKNNGGGKSTTQGKETGPLSTLQISFIALGVVILLIIVIVRRRKK